MAQYKIKEGDCIHSVALDHGFEWQTLWNHAENAQLKQLRGDPAVLNPGDVLTIPDKQPRSSDGATDQRHRFRRKGTPAKVKIQVQRDGEPRANVGYTLTIDGNTQTGTTDGNGMVEMKIPPNATRGELRVGDAREMEIYPFQLGAVDSLDSETGARQRLLNLGYDAELPLAELLESFQHASKLAVTGSLDQATQDALKQQFGE